MLTVAYLIRINKSIYFQQRHLRLLIQYLFELHCQTNKEYLYLHITYPFTQFKFQYFYLLNPFILIA